MTATSPENPAVDVSDEAEFLRRYNARDYDQPLASVDVCIFTLHEDCLKVLLVTRDEHPARGRAALPGGFVDVDADKTLEETALRKLQAKTGVAAPYLEQLATVGNRSRDPRGWSLTVVYFALIPYVAAGEAALWLPVEEALAAGLAFDHAVLLQGALDRLRSKVLYTLIPAYLIGSPFTLARLQRAYEVLMGRDVEKKAFRRRLESAGVLVECGEAVSGGQGRPARRFRLREGVGGFNFQRQLQA